MVILNKKKTFLYKDGEVKKYEFGIKMYWRMSRQIIICRHENVHCHRCASFLLYFFLFNSPHC